MAQLITFLSLLLLLASLATSTARTMSTQRLLSTSPSTNFTHVCDPERFGLQGLKMSDFAFCDKSLPFQVRAKDLVDRMTIEEKVKQMGDHGRGVPRLGLPKYDWWSEALHGVAKTGHGTHFDTEVPGATSFPTVIVTTASFNKTLWKTIGQTVSNEARAMYNLGHSGLTFWSPNINVVRDPRWGRTLETPGEDPYVVGTYAINYVRGLQDVEGTLNTKDLNSRPLKVSACCKHYTAYDLDQWMGVDRRHFDAKVTEQDMLETFQPPFEMCVRDGDASSAMCSFNNINGIPPCADAKLLNGTIRGEWNLHGYIVSDCDSIDTIVKSQKWLGDTNEDAVAQVLKAGLDLDCGRYYPDFLESTVNQGLIREADIDRSLNYLYVVLMRLGFFDGSFQSLGKKDICSDANKELAAEAARQGIVLLKNDNATLPLNSAKCKKIAVIGPHANATDAMIGNYAGIPCRYISPMDGIAAYSEVIHAEGCANVACKNNSLVFPAMQAAKKADATVILVGLDLSREREEFDREDLLLPGYQTTLVNQVAEVSKGPVIVVVMAAGAIDISFAKKSNKIQGILWSGYPGEEGGRAIADILFGKYNPGGRLPVTWYENDYVDLLPMTSMKLRPVDSLGYPGRTYKFFNGSTVYPFGYGLSYTNFAYNLTSSQNSLAIKLNKFQHCHNVNYAESANSACAHEACCPSVTVDNLKCDSHNFGFEVAVHNVGHRDGSEVVIVYSKPPEGIEGTHIKQVIGFERVFVPAGGSTNVKFSFSACKSLSIVDSSAYKILPAGVHTIEVGDGVVSFPVGVSLDH